MKLNFKEKYLIILVVLCFVSVGFYYSYAIFVTKQLQENVVAIRLDNKRVTLKIDEKDNIINIKGNSSNDFKLSLKNNNGVDYYYLILVRGLASGVKVSSIGEVNGEIKSLTSKEMIIHVNNTNNDDVKLEFIVKIGKERIFDNENGYYYINEVDNYDHSGANKPEIGNLKLIPVSYKKISDTEGYWYKTDETNQTNLWYSYENSLWANTVLVSEKNYYKYQKASIGTQIESNDILGFYVWIPRFKYYIINSSNYTNYERMNNVIFEKDSNSSGTIECFDNISNKDDMHTFSEVCTDKYYDHIYDNLSMYTHPSFKDKKGFWVGKFLTGKDEMSLPNVNILQKNIADANVISNKHNSHVLTNMEYAAIILLSNSAYGKTFNKMYYDKDNYTFTRIYANTYEYDVTGCSSEYNARSKGIVSELTKKCVTYNDLTNYSHVSNSVNYPIGYAGAGASSTGTINGVYDLASTNGEIVSAFIADIDGNISFSGNYYDLYSYNEYIGKVMSSGNIYNLYRYKLGDGIREHFRNFGENGMWNNGVFVQNKNTGVLVRGASASVYSTSIEDMNYTGAFRLVLN